MAAAYCPEEDLAMDGMFEMEDDYGFYEDLDAADDIGAPQTPLPSDDEHSAMSVPVCGSRIEDADPDSLLTSPPILSPHMVDAIAEDGLPWALQDASWDRLFASSRDGASFGTFMRRVRGHGQTIIVAKTSDGKIVGGYATDVWSGRKASAQDKASHAFLFTVEQKAMKNKRAASPTFIPGLDELELGTSPASAVDFDLHHLRAPSPKHHHQEKPRVEIIKPSQGLKQACRLGNKCISMSDEEAGLKLVIENSFSNGKVANAKENGEEFSIVEFEVYGFSED